MLRRCIAWDYSAPSIYMITIVLADRGSRALGRVVVERSEGELPAAAHCEYTDLGRAVADCWEAIPRFYPQIKIIAKAVMPDHFHGILWVREPLGCHLGQVIKGFKLGCNRAARALAIGDSRAIGEGRAIGGGRAIVSPGTGLGTGLGPGLAPGRGLFAEGFQDTILFRDGQLGRMIDYLKLNPLRLAVKQARPDLFRVVGELAVRLPEIPSPGVGHFSALGNRFLLDRQLCQVQCSRSSFGYRREPLPGDPRQRRIARDAAGEPLVEFSTPDYENRREALFAAARHGAVLLSPCVSDGERQLAHEALDRGLPLVVMRNKGFSPLAKPSGRYFDACSEGRLLLLSPAAWPYLPGEKAMTREDALAMNRLCQYLAGDGAAEINYHGARPADIDGAARSAARIS